MSADEQLVTIPVHGRGAPEVYHTDPDCKRLALANTTDEVSLSDLREGVGECSFCAGAVEFDHGDSTDAADRLADMTPDELGLSPIGERDSRDGGVS